MRWVADLVYLIAGLAYVPVALYHALVLGKNRRGWGERFGFVSRLRRGTPPGRKGDLSNGRIWIHAVSLGEINATPKLVESLRRALPGHEIFFSSTTDTGFARAVQLYGAENVMRFPLDFSLVVSCVLRRLAPTLILLVELEVWYNLVRMATRRGIPVAVVNGRLTERSARRLSRLGGPVRTLFADLAWVGAQDETIAARFRQLGVPTQRVEVTSSLKWDSALVADRVEGAEEMALALGLAPSRALWVCGSTGPGEEAIVLEAYSRLQAPGHATAEARSDKPTRPGGEGRPAPVLCIVPRKPERFDEVAELVQRLGFSCLRRSLRPDGSPVSEHGPAPPVDESTVILGDTMGELRKFYSLASVVFVGRSMVPMGGSDPMEVAALGKPMIVGPHMENFQEPVNALKRANALLEVKNAEELATTIGAVLADASLGASLGGNARNVVTRMQGAAQRTVDSLVKVLQSGSG